MALLRFFLGSVWLWLLKFTGALQKSPGLIILVIIIGTGLSCYYGYYLFFNRSTTPQTSAGQYQPQTLPPSAPGPVATVPGPVAIPQTAPPGVVPPVLTPRRQAPAFPAQPLPGFAGIEPPPPPPPRLQDEPEGVIRGWRAPLPARPYRPE